MANIVYMAKSAWTNLLDTIRSKASVSGTMTVSQATTAVENIETGGGDDGRFDALVGRTLSGSISGSAQYIGSAVFSNCIAVTDVSFSSATSLGAACFYYCNHLKTADFPMAQSVGSSAFAFCERLESANLPLASSIGGAIFLNCSSLNHIYMPNVSVITGSCFYNCYSLPEISLPNLKSMQGNAFANCRTLLSVYLMGSSVVSILNSTAFTSTPIAGYTAYTGGVVGSIFVPASLYDSYISSTKWSWYSSRIVSVSE